MIVYLAGPINGATDAEANDWRTRAKTLLAASGDTFSDPMDRDYRGQEDWHTIQIVENDKADIDAADAVIAWCPKPSVGTSMEILYCYERNKPCVVVVPSGPVSPWLRYHATAVRENIEAAHAVLRQSVRA
jgi:nucleoside 2-deoxyribosyltransferase